MIKKKSVPAWLWVMATSLSRVGISGAKTTLPVKLRRKIKPRKRRGDSCEERVSPLTVIFFFDPSGLIFSAMNEYFLSAATWLKGVF
jgi:hypothetical protein